MQTLLQCTNHLCHHQIKTIPIYLVFRPFFATYLSVLLDSMIWTHYLMIAIVNTFHSSSQRKCCERSIKEMAITILWIFAFGLLAKGTFFLSSFFFVATLGHWNFFVFFILCIFVARLGHWCTICGTTNLPGYGYMQWNTFTAWVSHVFQLKACLDTHF